MRTSEPAELARTANVLGALSLAITDRVSEAASSAAGQGDSAVAALSSLHHFLDDPTMDVLRQVLGLTPSGTVRLVDRLQEAGYVTREPGPDARSVSIRLTAEGREAAQQVSAARAEVLEEALVGFAPPERAALHDLVSRLLVGLMREPGATRWTCRLCDTTACGRDQGKCRVANEARKRYGRAE